MVTKTDAADDGKDKIVYIAPHPDMTDEQIIEMAGKMFAEIQKGRKES